MLLPRKILSIALLTGLCTPVLASSLAKPVTVTTIPLPSSLKTPPPKLDLKRPLTLSFIDWDAQGNKGIRTVTVFPRLNIGMTKTGLTAEGHEYVINPLPPKTVFLGKEVYARIPLHWYGTGPALVYRPSHGNFVMQAPLDHRHPDFSYKANKRYLKKQGYEVLGQLGRSFRSYHPQTGSQALRYFKLNDGKQDPKIGQSAPSILLSGVIGLKDGTVEYMDFSQEKGLGNSPEAKLEYLKQNKIKPYLRQLEARQDVAYFSIDTHALITQPNDIPAVVIRGNYQKGGPFLDHQKGLFARNVRIFNLKSKKLIAVMITPSLLMRDVLTLAKKEFGPDVGIQFLDGDEPAAAFFERTPNLKIKDKLAYDNHYIQQGVGQELIVRKK